MMTFTQSSVFRETPRRRFPPRAAQPAMMSARSSPKPSCACGGGCPRCAKTAFQAKRPGGWGDAAEREADRMAVRVAAGEAGRPELHRKTAAPVGAPEGRRELPEGVDAVVRSPGRPLDDTTRTTMEQRFGWDFGQVRVHADARAAASARAVGALAYTVGRDIVFDAGRYAPGTARGTELLGHELTHVVQQNPAAGSRDRMLQRTVSPDYATIEDKLTYGVFDWAVTDEEAHEVLVILNGLSDQDLADTVAAMDRDGLVDRLLDNITEEDEERYAVLIGRISRHRSVSHSAEWIVGRLSRGVFDWAVTDEDAHQALMALMGLESQELRTLVGRMVNEKVFDRLEEELPDEDLRRYPALLARLRAIRDEFLALVTAHTAFLRSRPEARSSPAGAGAAIRSTVSSTGYGGARATWPDLSAEVQAQWRHRAEVAIARVTVSVRGTDLEPILSRGKLVFDPEDAERNNAYAYVVGENELYFGRGWVEDAEADPRTVWQSIAHELGGHEEFGATWSWEIMRATLDRLTPEERREALSGVNSVYSAYGYLETEIYAELRELPYRIPTSGGDLPSEDVQKELRRIRDAFGPDVGRQIVLRLYYRVLGDPRVSESSRMLLYQSVQSVFGLFPISGPVLP